MPVESFPSDVTVVIVAHNAAKTLTQTVRAVLETGCPPSRLIIVDVASTDGAPADMARQTPGIRVQRLDTNHGPSPGRNAGMRAADTRFVFLMDADVIVEPTTIGTLHAAMTADSTIAVGSPVVVHADRPGVIQYAGTGFHFICEAVNPWLDRSLADRGTQPADIGAASTCGLLLARQPSIDVGLFDERYFIGKEDGDFTHRLVLAGYRIRELPAAIIRHHSRARSDWLFYYQIRNRWHVMLKDYQIRTIVLLLPALAVHEILQAVVLVLKGYGLTYLKAAGGLVAMLPRLPADRALVNRIRVRGDRDVLRDDPLVARQDLVGHSAMQAGARLYQSVLRGYWRLIRPLLAR